MLLKQKGAYSPHSLSNSLQNGFDISQREMHSKGMNVPLRSNVRREFDQRQAIKWHFCYYLNTVFGMEISLENPIA